ncbi:MAG TPA: HesA/MoeB/ThiF family protein [Tissierellales bacterium]|nr:HesA/MoeB/ThiF family protein [Tissierellales bacterium]
MKKHIDKRYVKNMNALSIGENKILNESKVCIVGCGGLGGYIIELLGRIGVGNLTVIDGDVFDETNLNRQVLCHTKNIGQNKAIEAKKRMELVNPLIKVTAIDKMLTAKNASTILKGHDVIVDALDNIKVRLLLQEKAKQLDIPMIHGAIAGFYGQVTTILPGDDILNKLYPEDTIEKKGIEGSLGNLSFIVPLIASMEVSEVIKLLIKQGDLLNKKVLFIDSLENNYDLIEFD